MKAHPINRSIRSAARRLVLPIVFGAGLAAGVLWNARIRHALGLEADPTAATASSAETDQLWTCGMHPQVIQDRPGTCPICGMALTPVAGSGAANPASSGEREVKYWWDPMMNPPFIADRPGRSPMGMDLVPVYADEVSAGSALVIDPTVVQNMGLRVATVSEAPLTRRIRAVGYLEEVEPNRTDVNLRVDGWIDRIHADFEGKHVEEGDPLFDIYSPALQVAVEELIGARKMGETLASRSQADALFEAATRKLELYGLARERVAELAMLETAPRAITFHAPATGHVVLKLVNAGAAVVAGQLALRIVDHTTLWLGAHVFEKDAPLVRLGQSVTATVDGFPGEVFEGEVIFVHPHVDPRTRTVMVRLALPNQALTLRPGMYATASLEVEIAPRAIVVPREAIIDTGERQIAFVALDLGHFEPRRVQMGASGNGGIVQVLSGLAPGEQVVVSGQFLLDAESRMKEAIQRFLQEKAGPAPERVGEEATASVLADVSEGWKSAVEAALAAYLEVARVLGQPQESADPVDVSRLVEAAHELHGQASGEDASLLAEALAGSATAMDGYPIEEQRKLFAAVSDAAIRLAERSPRSGELVPRLFVLRCPMVRGRWLQSSEQVANPYYATTMKACGEMEQALSIPGEAADPVVPGNGEAHR